MTDAPLYLDSSAALQDRLQDLISRLTLNEKIGQMNHPAQAIPRLGIPAYNYWNEALHGVARNGRATVFPEPIGMAATWDPDLILRIADVISTEARAKYHETMRLKGYSDWYQGLTFWSPNVNIFRDPRWGRGQETWGEDPFYTGEMGSAFVRGLQGDDPRYLKTAACAKHYAVHSGPEKDRHVFNAIVSRRDLYDTYLPAFKKLVTEANVESVMGAYNRVLDEPACGSQLLLVDILRGEWGFKGHVVSDCGALSDFHRNHKVTANEAESAALGIKMGCDLGCDSVYDSLPEALENGLLTEADIDRALTHSLATRFKLGLFDAPEMVPYTSIPYSMVGCEAHRELAYEAAVKSVVLLKNKNNILPLGEETRSILVVGPNAANLDVLMGNYCGLNEHMTTLLEGIVANAPAAARVQYRPAVQLLHPNGNPHDWSVIESANNDITIACMGISPLMEGEEGDAILTSENGDRSDIALPAVQADYIKKMAIQGARIVLVLAGGSPIALGEVEDLVEAIVYVWYPGQEGGRAVGDILFGKQNPSGKLPVTFPRSTADLPPFSDYSMANRTYRYSTVEPLFPFGFGLSYTRFAYADLHISPEAVPAGSGLDLAFTVMNTGATPGDEVAQVYIRPLDAAGPAPIQWLAGFTRLCLEPGASLRVQMTIPAERLAIVDANGAACFVAGRYQVIVGGCSPSGRATKLGAPGSQQAEFELR